MFSIGRWTACINRLEPKCWLGFLLSLSILCAAPTQAREIKDLALGVALYEFFQQEDFAALSEILIAEEKQTLNNQADFASQFAAGIMLSYGMDQASIERLQANQESGFIDSENQARSDYYLAKLLYRKGHHQLAFETLQSVDESLTDSLKPELAFLLHSSFLQHSVVTEKQGQQNIEQEAAEPSFDLPQGMAKGLSKEKGLKLWGSYLSYNQSVSETKIDIDALESLAQSLSKRIQQLSAERDVQSFSELLALRDRALLSVAYLYLIKDKPAPAIKHLRAYSAEGLEFDQALLAYGWAQLQQDQFAEALAAWQTLANGDIATAATRESLLGIPYLYELQGGIEQAAKNYEQAINRIEAEIQNLDLFAGSMSSDAASQFLDALQSSTLSWLEDYDATAIEEIDDRYREMLSRLRTVASSDDFIMLINQYRDVNWLLGQSGQWASSLEAMKDSVENQQQRFNEVFDDGYQQRLSKQFAVLEESHKNVSEQLAEVKGISGVDYKGLFNQKELDSQKKATTLTEKIEGLNRRAQILSDEYPTNAKLTKFAADMDSRYRTASLLVGNIFWNTAAQSERRIWEMTKSAAIAEQSLREAKQSLHDIEALVPALQSQTQALESIASLGIRLMSVDQTLQRLKSEIDGALLSVIDGELSQQRATLNNYLAQAQLARARLLDSLYVQQDVSLLNEDTESGSESDPSVDSVRTAEADS